MDPGPTDRAARTRTRARVQLVIVVLFCLALTGLVLTFAIPLVGLLATLTALRGVLHEGPPCASAPLRAPSTPISAGNAPDVAQLGELCDVGVRGVVTALLVHADGRVIVATRASEGARPAVRAWPPSGPSSRVEVPDVVRALVLHPDGTVLGTDDAGHLLRFDAAVTRVLDTREAHGKEGANGLAVGGGAIWTAGNDGRVLRWPLDLESPVEVMQVDGRAWSVQWDGTGPVVGRGFGTDDIGSVHLRGQAVDVADAVYDVDVSPQGNVAWSGDPGFGTLGPPEITWPARGTARDVAWSPDGSLLLVGTWAGDIRLVQVPTGDVGLWHQTPGRVQKVAWSPDGQWFATGGDGGVVRLWGVPETPYPSP